MIFLLQLPWNRRSPFSNRYGSVKCSAGQTGFFTRIGQLIKEKAKSDVDKIFSGFSKTRNNLTVIDELLLYWCCKLHCIDNSNHEAMSNEWLQSGNCPIAKSYRAVSNVIPLVAKVLQPPAGMKLKCPPAIVTAQAALAKTAFAKNLRPQSLPKKNAAGNAP
ncbi:hypothetical protein K1719_015543 [Acacia pycnantha]|nr:hypothetical protein K1719_015543 [Acacia pycnantha]